MNMEEKNNQAYTENDKRNLSCLIRVLVELDLPEAGEALMHATNMEEDDLDMMMDDLDGTVRAVLDALDSTPKLTPPNTKLIAITRPEVHIEAYEKLRFFVENSDEPYNYELREILFPIFLQIYLKLMRGRCVESAYKFFDDYSNDFDSEDDENLDQIQLIRKPKDLENNKFVSYMEINKVEIRLSMGAYALLQNHLKECKQGKLFEIVNRYLKLEIDEPEPDPEKLINPLTGAMIAVAGENDNKIPIFYDTLPDFENSQSFSNESSFDSDTANDSDNTICTIRRKRKRSSKTAEKFMFDISEFVDCNKQLSLSSDDENSEDVEPIQQIGEDDIDDLDDLIEVDDEMEPQVIENEADEAMIEVEEDQVMLDIDDLDDLIEVDDEMEPQVIENEADEAAIEVEEDQSMIEELEEIYFEEEYLEEAGGAEYRLAGDVIHPPYISLHAILEAKNLVADIEISDDGSLMAVGLTISHIIVWSLTKETKNVDRKRNIQVNKSSDATYRILRGHLDTVTACSFSPDNHHLVSASVDTTLRLWSLIKWECVFCYKAHILPVWDVRFSPNGAYFVSGSLDKTARLWTTEESQPVRLFTTHLADVDCVEFHPNCHYVATGCGDHAVRLFDILSGKQVRIMTGHQQTVYALKFSICGRFLASGSMDRTLNIWDIAIGSMIYTLEGFKSTILSLAFSSEGSLLAVGGKDDLLTIWNFNKITEQHFMDDDQNTGDDILLRKISLTGISTLLSLKFDENNYLIAAGITNDE